MNTFGTIDPKDYTIEQFYVSAPISWELVSSSNGCVITDPTGLDGAVTLQRASNSPTFPIISPNSPRDESGAYEYLLYSSVKSMFYDTDGFPTSGITPLASHSFVLSIGQQFYGERITPTSFTLELDTLPTKVTDDGNHNLVVNGTRVGRIFYSQGIAVITHNTASVVASVGTSGIKIVNGTAIKINYESDLEVFRHQVNVRVKPTDFNISLRNPSMPRGVTVTSPITASLESKGVKRISGNTWSLYNLMGTDLARPYITTIGLYNNNYELLAIAKLSTPIQRTFETPQIFIIKFDT